MSAIKDAIDLVLELEKRTSDTKTLNELLPIKQKIIDSQRENLELERKHLHSEREQLQKITDLTNKIAELKSVIDQPKEQPTAKSVYMTK